MQRSGVGELFYGPPVETFAEGKIIGGTAPDMTGAVADPGNGYWHTSIVHDDRQMWTDKVYELFGLPVGVPVDREWALSRYYTRKSEEVLKRVRGFGLHHKNSFILDAKICPEGGGNRWIRVLAVPIVATNQVVGLHGLIRGL
jgi:hypothetical protein